MCLVENEDIVGVAPTGDAPTTSEGSTNLLPNEVRLILETWRYIGGGDIGQAIFISNVDPDLCQKQAIVSWYLISPLVVDKSRFVIITPHISISFDYRYIWYKTNVLPQANKKLCLILYFWRMCTAESVYMSYMSVIIIFLQWPSYMYRVNKSGVISYRGMVMEIVVAAAHVLNFTYDIHILFNW